MKRRKNSKPCPTGKKRYPDQQSIKRSMKVIQGNPNAKAPVRYYECHLCNGWHMTNQDLH